MCLGTVVVANNARPAVEVADVAQITFEGPNAFVTTLFGEEHEFAGVTIQRVDMQRGVIITLQQETGP